MSQSPLQIIDAMLDPIIVSANKIRQVRDALPPAVWMIVPEALRMPLQALFDSCEAYDRKLGQMKAVGLISGVGTKAPE